MSIVLNKTIQIRDPKITVGPLDEAVSMLGVGNDNYYASILEYVIDINESGASKQEPGLFVFVFSACLVLSCVSLLRACDPHLERVQSIF